MGLGDNTYAQAGGGAQNPLPIAPVGSIATPSSGVNFSVMLFGNRPIPVWVDAAGQMWPVQDSLWYNVSYAIMNPQSSSSIQVTGASINGVADTSTVTTPTPANTSRYARTLHTLYTPAAAAVNRGAGIVPSSGAGANNVWLRGNAANQGGFFFYARWAMDTYAAGNRVFVGLVDTQGAKSAMWTADPSAASGNNVGFGMDAGDTNLTFYTNNATTNTKSANIVAAASGVYLDTYIYCKPNDTVINYRVDDLVGGTTLVNTSTSTTLPSNVAFLAPMITMGTGTNTAGGAIGISHFYIVGQQN